MHRWPIRGLVGREEDVSAAFCFVCLFYFFVFCFGKSSHSCQQCLGHIQPSTRPLRRADTTVNFTFITLSLWALVSSSLLLSLLPFKALHRNLSRLDCTKKQTYDNSLCLTRYIFYFLFSYHTTTITLLSLSTALNPTYTCILSNRTHFLLFKATLH